MKVRLNVVQGRNAPTVVQLDAVDVEQARVEAARLGWTVLSVGQAQSARMRRVPQQQLSVLVEQIHSLLVAGLSIVEVLETLARNPNTPWRDVLQSLNQSLREGQTLSQAMGKELTFPTLLTALVRSAEFTSDLPAALQRYLEHDQRAKQIRHQITSVALYPLLLTAVGTCVVLFLLLYVMPRFARIFETMSNLPWSAQMMVGWAHLLKDHGWMLGGGFASVIGLALFALLVPSNRSKLLSAVFMIPFIANRLKVYYLARWYRTTGMLVAGGISLPDAVHLANTVLPAGMSSQGALVELSMRQGHTPSDAYVRSEMSTAVADQLIRAGEKSGDVGTMLERAANFHEAEITKALENAMKIVEPVVMTLVGVGVGVLVILMYLPIFELASAIQ